MSIIYNNQKMFFADLHIHSRFSRACSKDLNLETLEKWAKTKGIDLLGTGDFTHPIWLEELRENLKDKDGIFYNKNQFKFLLTGEISLMYTQGRGRKVHLVLIAPSFEVVDRINAWIDERKMRRDYDGRPIFKISCEDFTAKMREISQDIEIIPAHIWTPHFGVLGSKSGFDSLQEAFGSQIDFIHAIETGISSTPDMNFRINELRGRAVVSFSDSHSYWPFRLGRESTIFSSINSYSEIIKQIRENKIIGTVETNPAYGKYHYDGHRNCSFSSSSQETKKLNGICPICKKPLLLGVEDRVEKLADFKENKSKINKIVFEVLPLHEVIAAALDCPIASKKTWEQYDKLIERFGNEFEILINADINDVKKLTSEKVGEYVLKNRKAQIQVLPGYDGLYGIPIFDGGLEDAKKKQRLLAEKIKASEED
jgi:uncharacterized protein (TIGR00375 family)